jgi:hypothetical protein
MAIEPFSLQGIELRLTPGPILKRLHKYMMGIDGISVISDEIRTRQTIGRWLRRPGTKSAAAQLGVHASFTTKS